MRNFVGTICTEFIKAKNTFAWWLVILGAAFMPLFVAFVFLSKGEYLVPQQGHNPWDDFTEMSWKGMGFMYTPLFIVLLVCLFLNIENKNNTWKHILTQPISKSGIYIGKLVTLMTFVAIFYILYIPFWISSGFLVGMVNSELQLTSHIPDYGLLFSLCFHSFIASLGILSLHFLISLRVKNMIIPIAFAVVCCIIWVVMFQGRATEIIYFPYAYHYSSVSLPDWIPLKMFGMFPEHEFYSLGYFIAFTGIGYWDFTRNFRG